MPALNLAENVLKERRVSNIASSGTNFLIWAIDMIMVVGMLMAQVLVDFDPSSSWVGLTYLFVTSVISPCLYYIGMPASKKSWVWPILMSCLG